MGTRTYNAQCQQDPTSDQGNIFHRDWWRFWHKKPDGFEFAFQIWDLTFGSKSDSASWVVGQLWWKQGKRRYLIDQYRERLGYVDTKRAIRDFIARHPETRAILIENKANGPAIIEELSQEFPNVIPIEPHGDKRSRAISVSPQVEAGSVMIPAKEIVSEFCHPTFDVEDFIEEHAAFKGVPGEVNDQVDCTSHALDKIRQIEQLNMEENEKTADTFVDLNDTEMSVIGGFES